MILAVSAADYLAARGRRRRRLARLMFEGRLDLVAVDPWGSWRRSLELLGRAEA